MNTLSPTGRRRRSDFKDLTGMQFGRWLVLDYSHAARNSASMWRCRCVCGREKRVSTASLTRGISTSCGCYQAEWAASNVRTHGEGKPMSAEYRIWASMIGRCGNPNNDHYERYGGRGIQVCDKWRTSYTDFLADMGRKPTSEHSIERRDNDKGYSPSNCYWATRIEQANNKRNNLFVTIAGETKTAAQWARQSGLSSTTIRRRMRLGMIGEAIIAPRKLNAAP